MGAVGNIPCGAIAVHAPVMPSLLSQVSNCDFGAVQQNAQEQITVMARMGEVGKALEGSTSKLQSLWQAGSAGAGAVGALTQIQGCFGDLMGQGADLGKRIQSVGKLLQSIQRIVQFVKAANAAVAAMMSSPFSMPAAKAMAVATTAQTAGFLGTLTQAISTVGQVISALQQATQKTDATTSKIGQALDAGTSTMPAVTMPTLAPATPVPTTPATPSYPAYPSYPTVTSSQPVPTAPVSTGSGNTAGLYPTGAGYTPQTGMPTVYQSGWIPQVGSQGTPAGGGTGGGLTIDITDADRDGKYEVKLNVPESQLNKDLKISVDAKVGDQEVKGTFDIDV